MLLSLWFSTRDSTIRTESCGTVLSAFLLRDPEAPPHPPPSAAARPRARDALDEKGPQRRLQESLDRRLEEVDKAVGGR